MRNFGVILGLVMILAQNIKEKTQDGKVTVGELLDILKDTTENLGISDVVILDISKIKK